MTHPAPIAKTTGSMDRNNPARNSPPDTFDPRHIPGVDAFWSVRQPRLLRGAPPSRPPSDAAPRFASPPVDHRRPDHPCHPHRLPTYVRRVLHGRPVVLLGQASLRLGQAVRDKSRASGDLRSHLRRHAPGQPHGGRTARPQGTLARRRGRIRQALPGGDRSLRPLVAGGGGHHPLPHRRFASGRTGSCSRTGRPSMPPIRSSTATSATSS